MKRDTVLIAVILLLTLFGVGVVLLMPIKSFADSRLYPYAELSYRFESAKEPRAWGSLGCPVSLGRFAPSLSAGVAPPGHGEPLAFRGDVALRFKF